MGVAILSGVLSSLDTRSRTFPNGHLFSSSSHEPASGISTPTASQFFDAPDEAIPSRFITTVGRPESVRKLRKVFQEMGSMGEKIEINPMEGNVQAVKEADVILVW